MRRKRILVTGGAGFLGSHLCRRLLADGHEVLCLDNFYTGEKANVADMQTHTCFELIRHDITKPIRLEVDQIYNLACPAAPGHYQYNPIQTMKTSVLGAINVLDLARECRARVLQASTSEVYGDPEVHPQREDYRGFVNPIGPRACYDEGKRAAETLMMDYHRREMIEVRIARIFNTYGPYMHPYDGRAVSNFIRQAIRGEPIRVYGDGSQTRSFCYVDDLIEGLVRLMNLDDPDITGPVNLGNPNETSMLDIARRIAALMDYTTDAPEVKIAHAPLPVDDPRRRRPDITLADQLLDWQPRTPLDEGLLKTIRWFMDLDYGLYRPPSPHY